MILERGEAISNLVLYMEFRPQNWGRKLILKDDTIIPLRHIIYRNPKRNTFKSPYPKAIV